MEWTRFLTWDLLEDKITWDEIESAGLRGLITADAYEQARARKAEQLAKKVWSSFNKIEVCPITF
jgi:hypothetical protein